MNLFKEIKCKHKLEKIRINAFLLGVCRKCGYMDFPNGEFLKPDERLKGFSTDELKKEIDIRVSYEPNTTNGHRGG
ncbi:hypothetical protein [Bacillus cereus]|uniref:hypothetical protein n=1 Tax=Bacillus cereus TaxID=1396 RepID=UPI000BF3B725|nr:hypothetical protein [Bacillus cereus]PEQ68954.1 hypothetical protein CN469_02145 [Bacillus cereus]